MSQPQPALLNGNSSPYPDRFRCVNDNYYGTVLDLCCKAGYIQPDKPDREIVGYDLDQYNIPHYKKFVQGNAEKTPFKDGEFRCVVLAEALNFVADPVKVINEAKRVTSETILFVVSNDSAWDTKNNPGQSLENAAKVHNISTDEQEKNDTSGKLSGPKESELKHLYPQRQFTLDGLLKLFDDAKLEYHVKLLNYSGFSFFVGSAWKSS